jgi:hypothetical protein
MAKILSQVLSASRSFHIDGRALEPQTGERESAFWWKSRCHRGRRKSEERSVMGVKRVVRREKGRKVREVVYGLEGERESRGDLRRKSSVNRRRGVEQELESAASRIVRRSKRRGKRRKTQLLHHPTLLLLRLLALLVLLVLLFLLLLPSVLLLLFLDAVFFLPRALLLAVAATVATGHRGFAGQS